MTEKKDLQELPPDIMEKAVRQLMRDRGRISTPRKAASSAENGKQGGRPSRPIESFECTCKAGDSMMGHKATCPRGRAIKRRQETG